MITPIELLSVVLTLLLNNDRDSAITAIKTYLETHRDDFDRIQAQAPLIMEAITTMVDTLSPVLKDCPNFTAVFKLTDSSVCLIRPYTPETVPHDQTPSPPPQHYH